MDRQEQLRLERERRQAKIKAAGSNRLAKITGTAGTQDFKEPVKTEPPKTTVAPPEPVSGEEQPSSAAPTEQSDSHLTPAPPKPANSDSTITPESPEAQITPKGSPNVSPKLSPNGNPSTNTVSTSASSTKASSQEQLDPLSAFLQAAGGNGDFDMSKLAAAFGQPPETEKEAVQQQANQQQYQQQHQPRRTEKTDFVWDFIHIVGAIGVGLYAALANPWNTTLVFVTLQVLQLATQVLLGQASTGLPGFVTPFVAMLPRNRQRQVYTAGGFVSALYTAYRDFSVSLVVFGAFSLGGRDYVRPM